MMPLHNLEIDSTNVQFEKGHWNSSDEPLHETELPLIPTVFRKSAC